MQKSLGEIVCGMYERAKTERGTFETHWQRVSDLIMPFRQFTQTHAPGDFIRDFIFDDTAPQCMLRLSAAIHGMLMNPATKWVNIKDDDAELNMDPDMSAWQDMATNELLRVFNDGRFGFATQSHELLLDMIGFGTAAMILTEEKGELRFNARPLNEIYLLGDKNNNVDSVIRKTMWSGDELADEFGMDAVSDRVRDQIQRGEGNKKYEVLHAVYPRRNRQHERADVTNKKFASVWMLSEGKHVLRESGFDRFPYLVPRLFKSAEETYGRGLGMTCLSDVAMINAERETLIVAGQKVADPPLLVDANSVEAPIDTDSGSIIYRRAGSRNVIEPLNSGARIDIGYQILEQDRENIKSAFMLDLVQLPMLDRMTATEVIERQQQQLVFMSPLVSRITSEWLEPLVIQTLEMMIEMRIIPRPPVEGARFRPRFESVMAMSQRASESAGVLQWLNMLTQAAQIDPTVLDRVDFDELASYSANHWFNVPERLVRTDDELMDLRDARAEMQQQQQQAEIMAQQAQAAERGTQAMKNAAEAQAV